MSLTWRYLDAADRVVGSSPPFAGRDGAEAFMSGTWDELAERGIERVELVDDETGESLYRMGLEEA